MLGRHCVKTSSSTQAVVALSSGEAERYGLVTGGSQGLGAVGIMSDLGVEVALVPNLDASAARGIALRRGLGKVRHIELNQLWLQDRIGRGDLRVNKVGTTDNFADILTKHVDRHLIGRHMESMGFLREVGRHTGGPTLQTW